MTTAIKEHPLPCIPEMTRAILDGRKSMTRRVMVPQPTVPDEFINFMQWGNEVAASDSRDEIPEATDEWRCPYGAVGDRLWVREAIQRNNGSMGARYVADGAPARGVKAWPWKVSYLQSRYMPRRCCRLILEVTRIRTERLQQISGYDIRAEGIDLRRGGEAAAREFWPGIFARTWDALNAARGYSWESNPFVWVVGFKRIEGGI